MASGRDDGKPVMTSRKGIDVGGTGQNGVWVKSAIGPGVTLEKTRSWCYGISLIQPGYSYPLGNR